MKTAAVIVGLVGAIAAFIASVLALTIGGAEAAFESVSSDLTLERAIGGLAMSILALVGAALSIAKPKVAAVLMVVSAVAGPLFIYIFYGLGSVLLLIAALLAFLGSRSAEERETN